MPSYKDDFREDFEDLNSHAFPIEEPEAIDENNQIMNDMIMEAEVDNEGQRETLKSIIKKHKKMFMRKGERIAPLIRTRHWIELTSNKIARVTPRKLSPAQRESVHNALKELLDLKIVRPSNSHGQHKWY